MAKIKSLRAHPVLGHLSDRELALFSRIVEEEEFQGDTVLFVSKMKSETFYLVKSGKVALHSDAAAPGEDLVMGEGETFGEWAILGPDHLTAVSARVVETAQLLVVKRTAFERFTQEEPAIALKVVQRLLTLVWEELAAMKEPAEEILRH